VTSRISGFYKLPPGERLKAAANESGLGAEEVSQVEKGLGIEQADKMVENVIGVIQVPLGIATNFIIDGREVLIPMATEEPSVIAAASNGARMAREAGGFSTSSTGPVMRAQIQVTGVVDPFSARQSRVALSISVRSTASRSYAERLIASRNSRTTVCSAVCSASWRSRCLSSVMSPVEPIMR